MDIQHAEAALAAVTGDCAAGARFIDMLKRAALLHRAPDCVQHLLRHRRVCDENTLIDQVVRPLQTGAHILLHTLGIIPAEFFTNDHFVINHFNAGLELQQVRAQTDDGRAASAFNHIIQPVKQETRIHTGRQLIERGTQLIQICRRLCQLAGLQNHVSLPGRKVAGVDHAHIGQALGRNAGILVRSGKAGADVYMNNAVILFGQCLKPLPVGSDGYRRRAAQGAARCNMGKNICRLNGHAVQKALISLVDEQRKYFNVILPDQFGRKVAGAVGSNFDSHLVRPSFLDSKCIISSLSCQVKAQSSIYFRKFCIFGL